ncbi:hypothetical protein MA16_Dca028501 [Dendrobium catenatum]|uniref:Uncharacterized protein n=1 Tax=Dendrobium catenatum TaxID=906689 RepID=A0A2I0V6W6_9ASPA|nr:hypothetical protein MA16_Dca028501 [Dendrobium catenatum]
MAGRKAKMLEGEIKQMKSDFVKISGFEKLFSSIREKIDEKLTIMEEMIKKLLEGQTKPATSKGRASLNRQENERNPDIGIMRKNQEMINF